MELGTVGIVEDPAAVPFTDRFHHRHGITIGLYLDTEHRF